MTTSNNMLPFAFGRHERRLFGIYHRPQATMSRPAVVLCNPFGQEAIRAYRFQRTLAERLARVGHPVLRFDYFGTGDSMGDDLDCSLDGFCQDLLTAHDELRRRSNANRFVWVGMRLGGTVALHSAHTNPLPELAKLILWDPILDGTRYLAYLRERHVASLISTYDLPQTPSPLDLAQDSSQYRDEAIGFALSSEFRRQIETIQPDAHQWPANPAEIAVITDPATDEGMEFEQIRSRAPQRVQAIVVQHGTDWTTDSAANTALVPTAALTQILQQAGDAR